MCLNNMLTSLGQGNEFENQVQLSEARSENGYGFWKPGLKTGMEFRLPGLKTGMAFRGQV